jgi:hypothetical protein
MIRLESKRDHTKGEHVFTLTVPIDDLETLDFNDLQIQAIENSTRDSYSSSFRLAILIMVATLVMDWPDLDKVLENEVNDG